MLGINLYLPLRNTDPLSVPKHIAQCCLSYRRFSALAQGLQPQRLEFSFSSETNRRYSIAADNTDQSHIGG